MGCGKQFSNLNNDLRDHVLSTHYVETEDDQEVIMPPIPWSFFIIVFFCVILLNILVQFTKNSHQNGDLYWFLQKFGECLDVAIVINQFIHYFFSLLWLPLTFLMYFCGCFDNNVLFRLQNPLF